MKQALPTFYYILYIYCFVLCLHHQNLHKHLENGELSFIHHLIPKACTAPGT